MISAATVQYNTPELVLRAYQSVRDLHPDMLITIIDGSDNAPVDSDRNTIVRKMGYNVGHGPGMHQALLDCETDYLLLFDSDIEMQKPCVDEMLSQMKDDTFAIGEIQMVDKSSYGVEFSEEPYEIPLVHPYFHIVQVKEYFKYMSYAQSGGPVGLSTLDIFSRGLSERVLIDFDVRDSVHHRWGGTRENTPLDMYKCSFSFTEQINKYLLNNWDFFGAKLPQKQATILEKKYGA